MDGVYVAGCMEGDCHFLTGNLKARRKVEYVKKVLESLGIEPERIEMYNMSSAEGPRFAQVANEFTERITELGPSPMKKPRPRRPRRPTTPPKCSRGLMRKDSRYDHR